jgi:hypothetical protein
VDTGKDGGKRKVHSAMRQLQSNPEKNPRLPPKAIVGLDSAAGVRWNPVDRELAFGHCREAISVPGS